MPVCRLAKYKWYENNIVKIADKFRIEPPKLYLTQQLYSTGGFYTREYNAITIAQWVVDNATDKELKEVIYHEIGHSLQWQLYKDMVPHSEIWVDCMKKLGRQPKESVYSLSPRLAKASPIVKRKGIEWLKQRAIERGVEWKD